MSKPGKHKETEHSDFFNKVEIPFEDGKDELWNRLSDKLDNTQRRASSSRTITMPVLRAVAAAIAILFISTIAFIKTHKETIECPKGQHLSHILPDGSTVYLNAESSLSYHPYWWRFQREVAFEGEGFFEVEKGQKFNILSKNGITEIMGTSFNIYSRKSDYKVFCKTGKIKVSSTITSVQLTIKPGELAIIDNNRKQGRIESVANDRLIAWKENRLTFTSESLMEVFDELERQFNVIIELKLANPSDFKYSGNFKKTTTIEESLNIICKSFNLKFTETKKNHYKVYH